MSIQKVWKELRSRCVKHSGEKLTAPIIYYESNYCEKMKGLGEKGGDGGYKVFQ